MAVLYDILLIVAMLLFSIGKVIDKKLLHSIPSIQFTLLTFLVDFAVVFPLVFFIELPSFPALALIALVAALSWITENLFYRGVQLDELSRVSPFEKFTVLFAILFGFLFLNERLGAFQYLGAFTLVAGGFLISFEKPINHIGSFLLHNKGIFFVLLSSIMSGIINFFSKFILDLFVGFMALLFFRKLFSALIALPLARKPIALKKWGIFTVSKVLAMAGMLLYFFVLSKQELSLTVPFLAIQPLFIAFLGKHFLDEKVKLLRILGLILIGAGYILVKIV
ncbi:DMT family transporter [Candidatus Woesearchaeota archaeon]|nr:DMT family transporter [Candidatus Woesearchaeota archaeon]